MRRRRERSERTRSAMGKQRCCNLSFTVRRHHHHQQQQQCSLQACVCALLSRRSARMRQQRVPHMRSVPLTRRSEPHRLRRLLVRQHPPLLAPGTQLKHHAGLPPPPPVPAPIPDNRIHATSHHAHLVEHCCPESDAHSRVWAAFPLAPVSYISALAGGDGRSTSGEDEGVHTARSSSSGQAGRMHRADASLTPLCRTHALLLSEEALRESLSPPFGATSKNTSSKHLVSALRGGCQDAHARIAPSAQVGPQLLRSVADAAGRCISRLISSVPNSSPCRRVQYKAVYCTARPPGWAAGWLGRAAHSARPAPPLPGAQLLSARTPRPALTQPVLRPHPERRQRGVEALLRRQVARDDGRDAVRHQDEEHHLLQRQLHLCASRLIWATGRFRPAREACAPASLFRRPRGSQSCDACSGPLLMGGGRSGDAGCTPPGVDTDGAARAPPGCRPEDPEACGPCLCHAPCEMTPILDQSPE